MWVKEVLEGKGFVQKGCWKWGVREKGHGDLERWMEGSGDGSLFYCPFPQPLRISVHKALSLSPHFSRPQPPPQPGFYYFLLISSQLHPSKCVLPLHTAPPVPSSPTQVPKPLSLPERPDLGLITSGAPWKLS